MILITGHKGFIGSRLHKLIPLALGIDLREGRNLLTCDLPKDIHLIYHLAAQSDVAPSWEDPLHDLDNIRMSARLAKEYPHAKIVYANSCASINPSSPYGFSKGAGGDYLLHFHKNTVNCVFPNIYGSGSRSVVDIFKGEEEVTIYGDGMQTRDFVHVDDIVDGLMMASHWDSGTYFMGSGISTNIISLAEGKLVIFEPARNEAHEVNVPNTTPNWNPSVQVLDYLNDV